MGDVERGLEHLGQGSDEALRHLAREEPAGLSLAEPCLALATGWKNWGDHELGSGAIGVRRCVCWAGWAPRSLPALFFFGAGSRV